MQDCSFLIANALEILQSCTKLSIWSKTDAMHNTRESRLKPDQTEYQFWWHVPTYIFSKNVLFWLKMKFEICTIVFNWQYMITESGNSLTTHKQQAISWTNFPIHWHIYASLISKYPFSLWCEHLSVLYLLINQPYIGLVPLLMRAAQIWYSTVLGHFTDSCHWHEMLKLWVTSLAFNLPVYSHHT